MKKIFIGTILLITTIASFCQQTLTKQDYLKKSKNQKIAAHVLLFAGLPTFLIAGSHSMNNLLEKTPGSDAIAAVGLASMLGSIPLYIAAKRNKRKAMDATAFIKLEPNNSAAFIGSGTANYPAVAIRINW